MPSMKCGYAAVQKDKILRLQANIERT
jgi:hypothetical protein